MKLKEWRIQKTLTQKELAAKAGVAEITVAAIERSVQLPTPKTSRKLANALGVDPTEIDEAQAYAEKALKQQTRGGVLRDVHPEG